jgi:uncharacterized protein
MSRPAALRAVLLAIALTGGWMPATASDRLTVVLEDTLGRQQQVAAELARDPATRQTGLMYRRKLAPGDGMLFVFAEQKPVKMWMRNTLLALDMLFFDAEGVLVSVAANRRPLSRELVGPVEPVKAVLELPAGDAARRGLVPGARLIDPDIAALRAE